MSTEISTLAEQLGLTRNNRADEQYLFTAFKQWLQNQTTWLLVLDHIDNFTLIDLLVPQKSSGHVLLTI